jgi:hypothetical protein
MYGHPRNVRSNLPRIAVCLYPHPGIEHTYGHLVGTFVPFTDSVRGESFRRYRRGGATRGHVPHGATWGHGATRGRLGQDGATRGHTGPNRRTRGRIAHGAESTHTGPHGADSAIDAHGAESGPNRRATRGRIGRFRGRLSPNPEILLCHLPGVMRPFGPIRGIERCVPPNGLV